jgi:hypothetical protein
MSFYSFLLLVADVQPHHLERKCQRILWHSKMQWGTTLNCHALTTDVSHDFHLFHQANAEVVP